jgi:NADPH:quinone reductase-like Zn-dependent oxidoreductase
MDGGNALHTGHCPRDGERVKSRPLPFTPGYDLVGVVEKTGPGTAPREGQLVADLCVVGGYAQYAIRPARFLVSVNDLVIIRDTGAAAIFDAL